MAQKRMLFDLRAQSLWESPLRTLRFLWAVQYRPGCGTTSLVTPTLVSGHRPLLQTLGRPPDASVQQTARALSVSALNIAVPGMGLRPSVPCFPLCPKSKSGRNLRVRVPKAVTLVR